MKRHLLPVSLLAILTLSITGIALSATIPSDPSSTPDWELAWVKLVDPLTYAPMTLIELSSEGEPGTTRESPYAIVISEMPQIFTVRISDGVIINKSSAFMPPSFGVPVGAELYTDRSGNGRYIVNVKKTDTIYVIYVYDILKNNIKTIPLMYKTDPLPLSIKITYSGKYILVGDQRGYLACYKSTTDFPDVPPLPLVFVSKTDPPQVYISAASKDDRAYLISRNSTLTWSYGMAGDGVATAISLFGEYIVFGDSTKKIYYFSRSAPTPLWTYTAPYTILDLDMSIDGESVAVALKKTSGKPTLLFWDGARAKTGVSNPTWNYSTTKDVESVSLSDDGSLVAAGCKDNKVYLFSRNGTLLWSYLTGGDTNVVRLSRDGKYLVAGSNDKKVYYFSTSSSTPLWSFDTGYHVVALAISGTGKYVAAGSIYPRIHFFDGPSGQHLWASQYSAGKPRKVRDLDLSYDGRYLVAGSDGYVIAFFDTRSSSPLWSYTGKGWISPVKISPDGRIVVAGSEYTPTFNWKWQDKPGGSVLIWDGANELQGEDQGPTKVYATGGDVNDVAVSFPVSPSVTAINLGVPAVVISSNTRLLYIDRMNKIYTAPILYVNYTNYDFWRVDPMTDSGTIPLNTTVTFNFKEPQNSQEPLQRGDYNVYTMITGYADDGYPFQQKLFCGGYILLGSSHYIPTSGSVLPSTTAVSGTYTMLQGLDRTYWKVQSYSTDTTTLSWNPQTRTLMNSTREISGTFSLLSVNNESYQVFRSSFTGNFSTGTGLDGSLTVSGTAYTDSVRVEGRSAALGKTTVKVYGSTSGFKVGDEVLIIGMLGTQMGKWETKIVSAIGSDYIVTSDPLVNYYEDHKFQVIRVPQYTNVTILSGGVLTASGWNPTAHTGGVVFFRVNGTVTVKAGGTITATGIGFSGGAGDTDKDGTGLNGDGLGYGRGGSSASSRGSLGQTGGGGGGGGHRSSGETGVTGGGSTNKTGGAGGASYGSDPARSLTMGSGGGGGGFGFPYDPSQPGQPGGNGGNGGGIIVVYAPTISVEGTITSNGQNGQSGGGWGASGGGGAGGTVYLRAASLSGLSNVNALGGSGGSGGAYGGGGGMGGDGYLRITQSAKYTSVVEFQGASNAETLNQLDWSVDSAWTVGSVDVKIQFWNYRLNRYATSGAAGYLSYTSGTVKVDETKTGTISISAYPDDFKDSSGNWKVRIIGEKLTSGPFDFLCDWIEFKPTWYAKGVVDLYGQFTVSGDVSKMRILDLNYYGNYSAGTVNQTMYLWNWKTDEWINIGSDIYPTASIGKLQQILVRDNIPSYIDSSGNVKVRIRGERTGSRSFLCGADYLHLVIWS